MLLTVRTLATPIFCLLVASVACAADVGRRTDPLLEQQRVAFRAVYPEVELGNWQPAMQYQVLLEDYVLWPDLRAMYLRSRVGTAEHAEIDAFLDKFGVLKPARELRYRYALHLAEEGRLSEYLAIYQRFYQGLGIAKLDCLALQAEMSAGHGARIVARALDLWLVGESQADECDRVFSYLQSRNLLSAAHYAQRFALAVESRRFTLARYLARALPPRYLSAANAWLEAQNKPLDFISASGDRQDEDLDRQQLAYAIERLAYDDPLTAAARWRQLSKRFSFSQEQVNDINRHIALWSARLHFPEAARMLSALPSPAANTETGRWLVRAYLLQHRWSEVVRSIDALPADESQKHEWQYWRAVALDTMGHGVAATAIWNELARERSYYGFLAADAIDAPYALFEAPVHGDDSLADKLAGMPALMRARELFFVGLEGRGRSEWDAAISVLGPDEQTQAALLAHSWGWHSRAISTVAAAGQFDALQIRYPLPWRDDFDQHASTAGIRNSWAYGVARSESLFMRDIRSSAGAIGVMQLMPETGRRTATELSLPYSGQATLTDSASNIRLGTWYLSKMFSRFDDNRVLATAAYNAGPLRVEDWLPETGSLDARIWIENIPYNETRGYVRRVLTDDAIFNWRLTGRLRRISSELPLIVAAAERDKAITSD